MLSQTGIARAWGPRCYRGPTARIALNGSGHVTVRAGIVEAVLALNECLKAHGYRTRASDTGALVCREKVGGGGTSNHSFVTALDLNWNSNPYGRRLRTDMPMAMVRDILAIRTTSGAQVWGWGGLWSGNKDPMHYEIVATPRDIATGIRRGTTLVTPKPTVVAPIVIPKIPAPSLFPEDEEEDPVEIIQHTSGAARLSRGGYLFNLTEASYNYYKQKGVEITVCNQAAWDIEHAAHVDGDKMRTELSR